MNKIHFSIPAAANYVYHMLSVARCGYDNSHGDKYRHLYPAEDLAVLKRSERLLTVSGGEHCGQLYWHLISQPSRGKAPIREFYEGFQVPPHLEKFRQEISEICAVMARNYDRFMGVWPEICREITEYVIPLSERFEASDFTGKAEEALGVSLESPAFHAVMTNSMEGGPEAIDIGPDQDVFCITRSRESNFHFIAHEYIIYLLKITLKGTSAFQSFRTWELVEALADYYLYQILGERGIFRPNHRWITYFSELPRDATPLERYLAAEAAMDKPEV